MRVSERLYREGQWKAVSPRGLIHKYREHIRYRNRNIWQNVIDIFPKMSKICIAFHLHYFLCRIYMDCKSIGLD